MDYHIPFNVEGIDIIDFYNDFTEYYIDLKKDSKFSYDEFDLKIPGYSRFAYSTPQVKAAYILATGAVLSAGITALTNFCIAHEANKANSPEVGVVRIIGEKGCSEIELIRGQPITESRINLELDKIGKPLSMSFYPDK